jgi:hypothetical protein
VRKEKLTRADSAEWVTERVGGRVCRGMLWKEKGGLQVHDLCGGFRPG